MAEWDSKFTDTYIVRLEVPKGSEPKILSSQACMVISKMDAKHPCHVEHFNLPQGRARIATIREGDMTPRTIIAPSTEESNAVAAEIVLAMPVERRAELGIALAADYPPAGVRQPPDLERERRLTSEALSTWDNGYRDAIVKVFGHAGYRKVMKELE